MFKRKIIPPQFHSCKTLPLYLFIEASCNDDLSGILISGKATDEEIRSAWTEIMLDYSSIINSGETNMLFGISKRVSELSFHVWYVQNAIQLLCYRKVPQVVAELEEMGYSLSAEYGNPEYEQQLKRISALAQPKAMDLEELRAEYDRLSNHKDGKKQTDIDFERNIAALSKYQSYRIDKRTTTAQEFAIIFKNFMAEQAAKEKVNV